MGRATLDVPEVPEVPEVPAAHVTANPAWRRLLQVAGVVGAVAHLIIGAAYQDLDAVAVAVSFTVALGLLRVRRGTVGTVLLGLAAVNVALWTIPATAANMSGRSGFLAIAVPGLMAVTAITASGAAIGALAARRRPAAGDGAVLLAKLAGTACVVVLGLGLLLRGGSTPVQPGDLRLVTDRTAFSETELVATAGEIELHLENRDYFWHTFTISQLDVDLAVPVSAADRVTFEAPPGTYEFVCAIPGHDVAGMVGTLTVVEP